MQADLEELKKKNSDSRDLISRIATKIPGFKGYVEKSENYNTDLIVREVIVANMKNLKKRLGIISGEMVKKSDLSGVEEINSLSNVLEGIIKKVEYADYGRSGAMSKVKFTEEDQDRLLEYDWRLVSDFEEIDKSLESYSDIPVEKIHELKERIREFEILFDNRKKVILEVI